LYQAPHLFLKKEKLIVRAELVRSAVLEIYEQVRREGARADQAMQRVIRREKSLRSVERRAVADAVYGLLRLQGKVDNLLGRALATKNMSMASLSTPTQHLLRYAGYLVVSGEQSAESAANLAGPEVRPHAWTLSLLAQPVQLGPTDGDPISALASETSLPRWLAALWNAQLGPDETRALATAINQRAPLTIRTNTLKATRETLEEMLATEDEARVAKTRWSELALTFTSRTNVFALKAFKAGLFEVQDEGSQLIAEACLAKPGQIVVDACAGAGGKTLALAGQMNNKGKLVACDRDGRRLLELKQRARRAGAHNYEPRTVAEGPAGTARIADLHGKADVVLIDAPCSGLGALRRNPDARWRLDEAEIDLFPPRQKEILDRYAALVKAGGRLIYATCSINQRENEEVRAHFLATHPEFESIDPADLLGKERIAALDAAAVIPPEGSRSGFKGSATEEKALDLPTQSGGRKPSAEKRLDVQLLPHRHGTDGFYIAGMRRKG
jgi:16S rRNA (cytosine967-C5)-methyltransferase